MSGTLPTGAERPYLLAIDLGERAILLILYAAYAVRVVPSLSTNPVNLLALVSEALVVLFVLIRRPALTVSVRPLDWIAAVLATALPLLFQPGGAPLAPSVVTALVMVAGLTISLWAKVSLQRSFGLAAANRGVMHTGPYRLVRHPMYFGYLLVHLGFLVANPRPWNVALLLATLAFQVVRILAEEKLLLADPAYVALAGKVRYRLIPGLF